ncbi:hypothetical protein CK203_029191 [Vitis vinifera]|uniref:Uncharacterized protein n=1 Tax=Vitis vinifera TaxID=29760 RepID=A0A438IT05_VITVI|nr:hypothetical protein CK203_029191 [Vitis vinifera]
MESQSCLLKRAMEGGYISTVMVTGRGGEGEEVSHLFLFGAESELEKSEMIPNGIVEQVEELVLALRWKEGRLPSTYLSGKYKEEEGGWWSCEVRDGYGVELWKSIRKERNTFLGHLSFMVGNGRRVKFWMDKWCGDEPSCVSFPSLKVAWVADLWVQIGKEVIGTLVLHEL